MTNLETDNIVKRRKLAVDAFHGKPPRLYFRLLLGLPNAWGNAARVHRKALLDTLARVGLTIELVKRQSERDPNNAYIYQYGDLTGT